MTLRFRREFFIPAGEVTYAQLLPVHTEPRFITLEKEKRKANSFTKQQREGLRYEKKAIEYLNGLLEKHNKARSDGDGSGKYSLHASRWIMFKNTKSNESEIRFCQPDAFFIDEENKKIILFEIKLQHTQTAWAQIRLLYEPVLRFIFPGFQLAAIELCKWLDPHSSFPEQYFYTEDVFSAEEGKFGIHLFKSPSRTARKRKVFASSSYGGKRKGSRNE